MSAHSSETRKASGVDETVVAQVQGTLRRRILRAFVARGLLESCDAKEMLAYQYSGFSVDAGVRIEAHDRAALRQGPPVQGRQRFGVPLRQTTQ